MLLRLILIVGLMIFAWQVQADCEGSGIEDKAEYFEALNQVKSLKEYKSYEDNALKSNIKLVAFANAPFSQKVIINGRCYMSITVHENHEAHTYRWHTFYVSLNGKHILVDDVTGGNPMTLNKWRLEQKKLDSSNDSS